MLAQPPACIPPRSFSIPPVIRQEFVKKSQWQLLPIEELAKFELVVDQFADFGLVLADAIAIHPSNPRFPADPDTRMLMPKGRCRGLSIALRDSVTQMHLWLMGSREITITASTVQDQQVTLAEITPWLRDSDCEPYIEQIITLKTETAKSIHITSVSPFTLTRFAVKQVLV